MRKRRTSLRKAHHVLKTHYRWYKNHWKRLSSSQLSTLESDLSQLDEAIKNKDRDTASALAQKITAFGKKHCSKSATTYAFELIVALVIALVVATIVRQMWFELMVIPTGSMRPTFKEKDRLIVTKTSFALNIPLHPGHFYFNPDAIKRTQFMIWSGENIDLPDTNARYFGIIPYTKRFIKRLIAKPGDTVYFYGGRIYGIDKDDNDLIELRTSPWLQDLEHIPFTRLEEGVKNPTPTDGDTVNRLVFHLMNQPLARLSLFRNRAPKAEVYNGSSWVEETPPYKDKPKDAITSFDEILGIHNFAMARLLTKEQLHRIASMETAFLEEGVLYLQLAHHHNLTYPQPRHTAYYDGRLIVQLTPFETMIPLKESHLRRMMESMYTARFVVRNGRATRYRTEDYHFSADAISFPDVPDGTYEFYYGKAYKISGTGKATLLTDEHPLYTFSPENVQKLFNLGVSFNRYYEPFATPQDLYPLRYAYYREGDLFLLGAPIFKKDDVTLQQFLQREEQREKLSRYVAFKDHGPPLKEGKIDIEFIKTFGIKIPENHYLVLGDNHAMSADSRTFGFVPQGNLEGTPSFILWPRFGFPPQNPMPWLTVPGCIVWSVVILFVVSYLSWNRRQRTKPVFHKMSS